MIKKILLFFLMLLTSYAILVFIAPSVASTIDRIIGFPHLSDTIRGSKKNYDATITDIPSLNEVTSGALDAKEKFFEGVEITKTKIDDVRQGAQEAQEVYQETKETLEDAKEIYDTTQNQIEQVKNIIQSGSSVK